MFVVAVLHPFNSPLPFAQNEKRNLKIFKTSFLIRKQKKKYTSANSVYLVTVRLRRASTHILFRYAPQNIRYTRTLSEIACYIYSINNKNL